MIKLIKSFTTGIFIDEATGHFLRKRARKHEKTSKQEDFLANSEGQLSTQENSRFPGGWVLEALRGLPALYGCRPPGQ